VKYKTSRIDWETDIPHHWDEVKGKYLFTHIKEIIGENWVNEQRISLTYDGVIPRDNNDTSGLNPKSLSTYQIIREDELLFKLIDLDNEKTSRVGLSKHSGITSSAYIRINVNQMHPEYYYFWYYSLWFRYIYNRLGNGVRSTLNASDLLNLLVPVPPIKEQVQISRTINEKIQKVDSLIKNQEQQIENLNDYKKSMISNAVTKGLNSNVKFKESGIEWLGNIPIDFKTCRLKDLLKEPLFYGSNKSGDSYDENYPRYIRITDIQDDNLTSDISNMQSYRHDDADKYMLQENDILFARSGATSGKTYMVKIDDTNCVFAGYLINGRFDVNKVNPSFLYYYTKSSIWDKWKNYIFIQATIQNISAEKYNTFYLSLPPKRDQEEIVNYLDNQTQKLNRLIELKNKKIEELKTYKKSIIYEFVTGKKAVS
jgi:type I restriction enzyme S subunit